MSEAFLALLVGALLAFHAAMALRWERERARLLAVIVAPSPGAAYRAAEASEPRTDTGERPSRPVPVGAE